MNRVHRGASLEGRTALDAVVDNAVAELSRAPSAALRARGAELQSFLNEWRHLRPAIDVAFDQALAARDDALRKSLDEFGNRFLAALEAASSATEMEIQSLDPALGSYIDARAATWVARQNAGAANVVVLEFLASGRAAKPEEWLRLNTLEAQAAAAWKLAQRSIEIAGAETPLRAIYARADGAYFTGRTGEMRQAAFEALMKGRPIPTSATEWDAKSMIGLNAVSEAAIAAIDAAVGKARASAAAARQELVIAVAAMMLAAGFAGAAIVIVQVRVVRGILGLVDAMRRLAGGQLDTAVPGASRTDELGAMARAVQVFKDNLIRTGALEEEAAGARRTAEAQRQTVMHQMADAFERAAGGIVGRVASSAGALQATAKAMAATAAETAERSFTVAAAADQAAANVGTVAAASEELGTSVREIGRQVSGSADLARAAVDEADRTAELVEALTASVARIDEVVGLISGIAAQTNLLALNATIEAARAGAAGKGFAVVAAEVKALADQTARATDEIGRQIGQVQGATGQAVSAIERIAGRIREINGVAASIAAAVEEQAAATQEIVRNVGQAAAGTGEVTSTIAGVAGAAEKTGIAADQVLTSASELSRQSDDLTKEVHRFLATVRAA
ncbi:methyl-accepting chemotaxis protein [Methylobacterium sp. E-005]|uniref:methyl-accepting chemotaxis protein n=1 Tax=Methylobacterium sp. E-005 TaxID=2836549 RepID=UPI001FBA4FB3|nr:HAMP domain-containing methyl-accepting chemotaxis protein [Methylobacterium sp. E-005]MCJ2087825.1 methyl-accepting chemotaxis protein [Methylobacterium sp. E-005]